MTLIKICCMASIAEAELAIAHGAAAIGLVGEMPSGPGPIPEAVIREIAQAIKPPIRTFLLTSKTDVGSIVAQVKAAGVTTVQIVDHVIFGSLRDLRSALPDTEIVQVIHVRGEISVEEALSAAPFVDALLLDSGDPTRRVKELGGTGRVHDWEVSTRIAGGVNIPVWLAGGLTAANVNNAIRTVRPYGVDVCSGVRTNGALDAEKLKSFAEAVRSSSAVPRASDPSHPGN